VKSEDVLVSNNELGKTKRNGALDRRDIVLNYLTDNEKIMQQLIIWFLNAVMNEDVTQVGVLGYARSRSMRAHRNRYLQRSLKRDLANSVSRNRSYGRAHLKRESSSDTPGLKKPW
jgi:hypothetical protein